MIAQSRGRLVFVLLSLCVSVHVIAVDDDSLETQLRLMDERVAEIHDLTANFEQRKHTVLLREPIVSRGTVRLCGQRMRWDTQRPSPSVTYLDETDLKIHYPEHSVLEIYKLDDRLMQLAASPLPRLDALKRHFEITRDQLREDIQQPHIALRLTPRSEDIAKHVRHVLVAIDRERAYLLRMEVMDHDDERTVILLTNHRINTDMDCDSIELVVPAETRIVRPLDDLRNGGRAPEASRQ